MSNDIKLDLQVEQVLEAIAKRNPELAGRLKGESAAADLLRHVISQTLQHGADPAHAADVVHNAIDRTVAQTMEHDVDIAAPAPGRTPGRSPE